eukprot:TRINITY_DN1593_c0_g1_i1.p1 TRINITY_DN1593_c0_g1~~TRINITY_DN1593_c0_g1_i1.p1  ORF type:complete len:487 (+),score=174.88 TRINITY_DN1593_c0_g1_i1:157-1617(+)
MVFSVREIPAGGVVTDSQQTHYAFEPAANLNQTTMRIAANQCHMTQLMAQMSQLVNFSGDLFNNLLHEATSTYQRINGLASRIQSASQGIDSFDKFMSNKSGQSLMSNPRTEYVNLPLSESSFFTTENRPEAVKNVFSKAENPPKLYLMDTYIEGSENGLKALDLYTSPRFFLDEWIAEQMKLRQAAKEERKKRREERKARRAAAAEGEKGSNLGPAKPKRLEKVQYDPLTGERIVVKEAAAPAPAQTYAAPTSTMTMAQVADYSWSSAPPPTIESNSGYAPPHLAHSASKGYSAPPPPTSFAPPPPAMPGYSNAPSFGAPPPPPSMPGSYSAPSFGAPPPPPPQFGGRPDSVSFGGPPPPPPAMPGSYSVPNAPNAPPPPPVPGAPPPPPAASFNPSSPGMANALAGISLKSAPQQPVSKPVDARSDLLSAIRGGRALNKVQVQEKKEVQEEKGSSVASILARRIAIVGDDSDSEDEDGDEDEWD